MNGVASRGDRRRSDGFTLLELLLVIAVIGIMTAVSVPPIVGAIAHTKLRAASSNLAGLVQSGRIQAIKRNRTTVVQFVRRGNVPFAFVKNVAEATPDPSTAGPEVQLGGTTLQVAVPSGTPPALADDVLSFEPLDFPELISFNSRGLPCKYAAGVCTNAGFIYYLTDTAQQNAWTAVSISPGGRVKQWFWNGSAWVD